MFSSRLIPEFADDGTVESVLSIASNITEQELIDAALRESKARLEFTLAAAHVGEWEIDVASGECRHSDLYDRCFGYAAPVPGWNLDMLFAHVHPDDRERVRALVAHAFATRHRPRLRVPRRSGPTAASTGSTCTAAPTCRRAPASASRRGCASSGIIADITLRKHTEATLRDADLRKDEFLATLAHELRNPLAPIRNAVQIMQLSRDEAMHDNARKIIERQLKQMVHLVDDLLDVSRISQGKVELRLEQVDVADAVLDAIETSRPLIDAGRHHLTTRLAPPRALMVEADVTRLCQIVANLLNNAAKYTPEGGHIQVLAERDGDEAVITVQDSGIGLTQDMLPRVFDMFAQVDRSMERAQGGLGIGLALVKRLVEMHGGSVAATSDGPDRGCRFVVRLPLIRHPERAPRAGRRPRTGGAGDRRPARAGGRRQRRQRREPVAGDADPRLSGGGGARRRRGGGDGRELAAGGGADGHRHAAHERPRGGARDPRAARRRPHLADRAERLGPERGPPQVARGRLRPPFRQAGGRRGADRADPQAAQALVGER